MKKNFFSVTTWRLRFGYALQGMAFFVRTEHTARLYLFSSSMVIILSLLKGVSKTEFIALVVVTGLVWVAELFNTAIEQLADLVSLKFDVRIKVIKDLTAAAVLFSAFIALVTGMVIFVPKFWPS